MAGAAEEVGHEPPTEEPDEERVRPCLACGTLLPFDALACSLCGTRIAAGAAADEAVKPCMACEALISENDIFCPECGDYSLQVAAPVDAGSAVLARRRGGAVPLLSRVLAVLIALLAVACAVALALDVWRLRERLLET